MALLIDLQLSLCWSRRWRVFCGNRWICFVLPLLLGHLDNHICDEKIIVAPLKGIFMVEAFFWRLTLSRPPLRDLSLLTSRKFTGLIMQSHKVFGYLSKLGSFIFIFFFHCRVVWELRPPLCLFSILFFRNQLTGKSNNLALFSTPQGPCPQGDMGDHSLWTSC